MMRFPLMSLAALPMMMGPFVAPGLAVGWTLINMKQMMGRGLRNEMFDPGWTESEWKERFGGDIFAAERD